MKQSLAVMCLLIAGMGAQAHEHMTFDELSTAFGWDFDNTEIRTETVAPGLYVLFGVGGNIIASIGDQGVLMVDSQFPQMVPKIAAKIASLGGDSIDFTINTHWHFDHSDGNPVLGRDGSWMVSQINSRRMMAGEHDIDLVRFVYNQPAYPEEAWPIITYSDHMQFHFNGETVDLLHFGPAHTTGDTAVLFRNSNVVHMGDVFNAAGYPFIDAGNGGDISGMVSFCESVLARLNDDSTVVPGHGPVVGYDELAAYTNMLSVVRDRIDGMIDAGKSLEEVVAAAPTAEFDEQYGDPTSIVNRAYKSLSR